MIRSPRRTSLLVATLATVVLASSCSTTDTPAASVGSATLSDRDFAALLDDLRDRPEFGEYTSGPTTVRADAARNLLSLWISAQVLGQEIERRGAAVTPSDLDEMDRMLTIEGGGVWSVATERIRDFYLPIFATQEVFARIVVPHDDELREQYDQGGLASGVACPRHIQVDTEAEASDVLDQLADGADFATLAAELSRDTFTGAIGGILEPAEGASCFTAQEFSQAIIPEFVDAILAAEIGVPSGPVMTPFGWHVVLARPFDEVVDGVRAIVGGQNSTQLQQELITSSEAQVASKYGTWVAEVGSVLPVGRLPVPVGP